MATDKKAGAAAPAANEEEGAARLFADRAGNILADMGLDVASLGGGLRDAVLDLFKHRPKPWEALLEKEQRDIARLIKNAIDEMLAETVMLIAADERGHILARLDKFGGKAGKYQITLAAQGGPELASDLARLDGHAVLIISADADAYLGGGDAPTMADQPPLEFDEKPPLPPHDEKTGELLEEDGDEE